MQGSNAGLLFFFVFITQISDVFAWPGTISMGRELLQKTLAVLAPGKGPSEAPLSTGVVGALLFG